MLKSVYNLNMKVLSQVNQVYLCKLSGVQSETAFKNHLQMFSEQEEKKIMILVGLVHT